jgi:hypothetical protein
MVEKNRNPLNLAGVIPGPLRVNGGGNAGVIPSPLSVFGEPGKGVLQVPLTKSRAKENKSKVPADEFKKFVAIVYGEANICSETAWIAIGHVIVNRVGKFDWARCKTVTQVILQRNAFEAYGKNNYSTAYKYLSQNTKNNKSNPLIDRMIEVLRPVYDGDDTDITSGAVLYYSPKTQKALGRKKPNWNYALLDEVKIEGLEATDDFKFYKYKNKPKKVLRKKRRNK